MNKKLEKSNNTDNEKNTGTPEKETQSGSTQEAAKTAASRLDEVLAAEKEAAKEKEEPAPETDEEDSPKTPKKKKEHKKLRHGTLSVIYSVIFVAAIVMLNIVAGIIFERFPLQLDLTKSGIYSISEESEKYVKSIDTDVTIKIFAKEENFVAVNDYTKQANEVIKRISQFNSKIKVEYIDIDSNPDIISEYPDQKITAYSIIVETLSKDSNGNVMKDDNGKNIKRIRQILLLDLISLKQEFEDQIQQTAKYMNMDGMTGEDYLLEYAGGVDANAFAQAVNWDVVEASSADQAVVSALMAVTDHDPKTVCVLTGRQEIADVSYLKTLLTANGYIVNEINITSEDIPADTNLAIVPAPAVDYLEAEITKLDNFVYNNGNMGHDLVYIASYEQQSTPNLDEFLEEYNISVSNGIVYESDKNYYYTQPYETIAGEISDTYSGGLPADAQILFFGSRPVKLLAEGENGKIKTEALLKSSVNASVADKDSSGSAAVVENGQQTYAAIATKTSFSDDGNNTYSHIFVTGCDMMMSSNYLRRQQYQNREYTLNLFNSMTGKTTSDITIAPKVITGTIFDITAEQISTLKLIFIGVIPAVTLAIGLFIWLRRKNR